MAVSFDSIEGIVMDGMPKFIIYTLEALEKVGRKLWNQAKVVQESGRNATLKGDNAGSDRDGRGNEEGSVFSKGRLTERYVTGDFWG